MDSRKRAVLAVIRTGRKLLANSPVNNWAIAGRVKGRLFRYGYGNVDTVIQYKGIKIVAPARDVSILPGLVGGYYEATELDIFKLLAGVSRCIIDVGGNIGLYAVMGASHILSDGKIYVFEPIAENVEYINRNLKLNDVGDRVIIEPVAVGKEPGELTMHLSKNNVGNHSAAKTNVIDAVESVQVPRVSLDEYVKHNGSLGNQVDIVKIDVEGYDGYVLEGATQLISTCKPTLFVEFLPKLLENCGYDPARFFDILFHAFPTCYLVDEIKDNVTEVKQDDIAEFTRKVSNSNLIFVSNPVHRELIEAHIISQNTHSST